VLTRPERWAIVSCCDWYPDPTHFPTDHAALLRADEAVSRQPSAVSPNIAVIS
jgi:hypothetical protein